MKKLAAILCLSAMATGAFAQGIVTFNNNPNTLISATINGSTATISGAAGSYYFGLLAGANATSLSFTGLYATNSGAAAGRFIGGNVAVPGWAPGTAWSYQVVGWSANLGPHFNPAWLTMAPNGLFGASVVANGPIAGGVDANGISFPTPQLFGGNGIPSGFSLTDSGVLPPVPEPSSVVLAALGAGALLICRRRK